MIQCGGKLKHTDEDDCGAVACAGHWDDDDDVRHIPSIAKFELDDAPRVRPWYTREPTQEANDGMDRLEAAAKGELSKYAAAGDGTDLGALI